MAAQNNLRLKFPCKEYRKLRHSDFTKKVPRVIGEGCAKNFSHPIRNAQNGDEAGINSGLVRTDGELWRH